MRTKRANDGTVFVSLPVTLHRPITGGCQCPFCHAHPNLVPAWDTVAAHPDSAHTWTVHYPELSR